MSIPARDHVRIFIWAGVIALAAGSLYVLTAARDLVVGDTPELITVATTLGVAHPSGYPLFTILGHLFSLLPFGPLPFRVNLLSSVCNALTVGVVFLIAFQLTKSRAAAVVAALALAVNPLFWSWSLAAEVFSLNNLLVSVSIYLLVLWYEEPDRNRLLFGVCLFAGLAVGHHQSSVLLFPAYAFVLWEKRTVWQSRPSIIAICALCFAVGFLPYVYILWAARRHPVFSWGDVSSVRDLLRMIMRKSYGTGQLVSTPEYHGGSNLARIWALCRSFGLLGGMLTLLGLIRSYRHLRWYFWFSVFAFAMSGVFFVAITNLNLATTPSGLWVLERFFILPRVVTAPLMAMAVVSIAEVIRRMIHGLRFDPLWAVSVAVTACLLVSVIGNYRSIDESRNHVARNMGMDVFATLEPHTILLATGDAIATPLIYLQAVEAARPDVTLVVLPLLPAEWYVNQLGHRYPDLKIPFGRYDGRENNLRAVVEANAGRSIAFVGQPPANDHSLSSDYWLRQYGLVNIVQRTDTSDITALELANDNQRLFARYTPLDLKSIKMKTFEKEYPMMYALGAARTGGALEQNGYKAEARVWYQRALQFAPDWVDARNALARVEK